MGGAPRFTVLMPTHYRPDVIGEAIGSVLRQTEPSFELLIVGDGVTDATREMVKVFDDPRIRWFDFDKAPGYGYANRNRALLESHGELVALAADDDLMFPDHLALLGEALAAPGAVWAYSQALWASQDGVVAPDLTNLGHADERDYFAVRNTLAAGCVAYRANAFARRDPWPADVKMAGDWQMWKRLLKIHGPEAVRRVPQPTLIHFTAGRKTRRDSHFPLLNGFLTYADRVDWWPDLLRAPSQQGQQAHFAALLETPEGPQRLRQAAQDLVARIALEHLAPRVEAPRVEARNEGPDPVLLLRERDRALRALAEVEASRSWRITAPLRRLSTLWRGRR